MLSTTTLGLGAGGAQAEEDAGHSHGPTRTSSSAGIVSMAGSYGHTAESLSPSASLTDKTGIVALGGGGGGVGGIIPSAPRYEVSISMACTRAQLDTVLATLAGVGSRATINIDQQG